MVDCSGGRGRLGSHVPEGQADLSPDVESSPALARAARTFRRRGHAAMRVHRLGQYAQSVLIRTPPFDGVMSALSPDYRMAPPRSAARDVGWPVYMLDETAVACVRYELVQEAW